MVVSAIAGSVEVRALALGGRSGIEVDARSSRQIRSSLVFGASRHVGVDSTLLRGVPDRFSKLVFRQDIECRSLPWPDQERLLIEAGDVLGALTGFALPYDSLVQLLADSELGRSNHSYGREHLEAQCKGLRDALRRTGAVLPLIHRVYLGGVLEHRAQPETLGWVNYWSAETCEYLGFPDSQRDADLLRHSYRATAP
jgi:hypothetical protein